MLPSLPQASIRTLLTNSHAKIGEHAQSFCRCVVCTFVRLSFSSPEAALLLVSTKNCDLWPGPTPEARDSRTSRHSAHAQSQV